MSIILRGRFEPLALDFEIENPSPGGAVIEYARLLEELEAEATPAAAPKPAPPPKAAPKAAPAPAPAAGPDACSECGAEISASEKKASVLFVSRALCRECMQKI